MATIYKLIMKNLADMPPQQGIQRAQKIIREMLINPPTFDKQHQIQKAASDFLKLKKIKYAFGEKHYKSTLTNGQVDMIRVMRENGNMSYGKIAKILSVPRSTISNICAWRRRTILYEDEA